MMAFRSARGARRLRHDEQAMKRKVEAQEPPSATGESFMRLLRVDHGRLSRVLREIDVQQVRLSTSPESAGPVLAEAMQYLLHYQHAFHHPREDRLFARIAARAPRFSRDMRQLMREHRGGLRRAESLVAELTQANASVLRGRRGARLARRLADYVEHTRDHMRNEEAVFYAQAERALKSSDWPMLHAETTPADPTGNPVLLAQEYPHLAARLFHPVSDVGEPGDPPGAGGSAPERARGAVRDGLEQLVELYGELIDEGVEIVRANLATVSSARSPWALVRAAGPVGLRNCRFVARCVVDPSRLTLATFNRFLAAFRPVGAASRASQDMA